MDKELLNKCTDAFEDIVVECEGMFDGNRRKFVGSYIAYTFKDGDGDTVVAFTDTRKGEVLGTPIAIVAEYEAQDNDPDELFMQLVHDFGEPFEEVETEYDIPCIYDICVRGSYRGMDSYYEQIGQALFEKLGEHGTFYYRNCGYPF